MSMQSTKINRQSSNKTTKFPKLQSINTKSFQNLLVVGGLHINMKKLQGYNPQIKPIESSTRKKSHRSFGRQLQHTIQSASLQIKKRRSRNTTQQTKLTKQTVKCNNYQQKEQNNIEKQNIEKQKIQKTQKQEFVFVQKKMKLGHKGKVNFMKQFIIDTLTKGKVEGNCLTIHKGTAQCMNSPKRQYNRSQVSRNNEQKYPLVIIQQRNHAVIPNKNRHHPPLPHNRPKMSNPSGHHTAINLPSLSKNKKWVAMVKKIQKKELKEEEIIEQIIVQQNKSDFNKIQEIIPEQIKQ